MKLNAESQPTVDDELVTKVGQFFGYETVSWSEFPDGIENTVIVVALPDGSERVQKHYNRNRELMRVSLELITMSMVSERTVATPQLDRGINDSQNVFCYQAQDHEWYVISMDRVKGSHPNTYKGKWVEELAQYQASLHNASSDNPNIGDKIDLAQDYSYFSISKDRHPKLAALYGNVLPCLERLNRVWSGLPNGLSHQDITRCNILVNNDTLAAVIDFEDTAQAPYIYCLAGTLWDIITSSDVRAAAKYVEDYRRVRPLTQDEVDNLSDMTMVRGWIDLHGKILSAGYNSEAHLETQSHLITLLSSDGLDFTGMTK